MQTRFRVHSAALEAVPTTATLPGGQTVEAHVAGLCVELVEVDGEATLTRRFVPEDIEAARAMFAVAAIIICTLAPE